MYNFPRILDHVPWTWPGGPLPSGPQAAPAKTLAEGNGASFITRDILAKTRGQYGSL